MKLFLFLVESIIILAAGQIIVTELNLSVVLGLAISAIFITVKDKSSLWKS